MSRRTWRDTAIELIIGLGIGLVLFLVFP